MIRREYVEIYLKDNEEIRIVDFENKNVEFQRKTKNKLTSIVFQVILPSLGYCKYSIEKIKENEGIMIQPEIYNEGKDNLLLKNDQLKLYFTNNGMNLNYIQTLDGMNFKLFQEFKMYHTPADTIFSTGLYIFRIETGVFFLIQFGIGISIGMIISIFINFILYFFKWNFFSKRIGGFHLLTFGIFFGFSIYHFIFEVLPLEWYHYALKFNSPFGLVFGVIFSMMRLPLGFRKFLIIFFISLVSYVFVFLFHPKFSAKTVPMKSIMNNEGNLYKEIEYTSKYPGIEQTIRIFKNEKYLDFNFNVDCESNKEMIATFKLDSNFNFFTDRNSFGHMKRNYNYLEPIPSNYYPITSNVLLNQSSSNILLLVSQSMGVSNFENRLEFMLNRCPTVERERGLIQSTSHKSKSVVNIKIYFNEENKKEKILQMSHPIIIYESNDCQGGLNSFSMLKDSKLISKFHLISFQIFKRNEMLMRFESENDIEIRNEIFHFLNPKEIRKMSLNLNDGVDVDSIHLNPSASPITSFLIKF
jgi:hypothetical protein